MTYSQSKKEFQKALSKLPGRTTPIDKAMLSWMELAELDFMKREHSVNGLALFPYLAGDDPDDYDEKWKMTFCNPQEVKLHWSERKAEFIGGESSFLIGWFEGGGHDDFVFLSTKLREGVAIIHHDDVFAAKDVDMVVQESITGLRLHLERLVELLFEY